MNPREKNSYRTLALTLIIALAISAAAIAQQSLSGFSISSEAGEYSADVSESGGGSVSGNGYEMEIFSDALQGKAAGSGYSINVGSGEFLAETPPPVISNLKQSSATPKVGESVKISGSIFSEAGLKQAVFFTNETGTLAETESKALSGNSGQVEFVWSNELPEGSAVLWKISADDLEENSAETEEIVFVVGAVDLEPPKISSLANYPDPPAVGEEVIFTADVSDDFGLSSAALEINGKTASTINLVGKAAKAQISFKPEGTAGQEFSWRIFAVDSSGKQSVSQEKKFALISEAPQVRQCPEAEKPKPIEGLCIGGKKKVIEVSCNEKNGKWETSPKEVLCAQNLTGGFPPIQSLPIPAIAAAIIFISAAFLAWKKREGLKKFIEDLKKIKIPLPTPPTAEPKPAPLPEEKKVPEKPPARKKPFPKIFIKSLRVPEKKKPEKEE